MIESKYEDLRDLGNRGTFQAVLRAEIRDNADLITARYVVRPKNSDEDKEER